MTQITQRLTDIAACRRNYDDMSLEAAARNLMDDKPAYWSMAGGTALGLSASIAASANFRGSLIPVLAEKADDFARRGIDVARAILDQLIPLNMDAVEELDRWYRLHSTFRDRDNLLSRETLAINNPYSPAYPNDDCDEVAKRYADLSAAAQDRLVQRNGVEPQRQAAE